MFTRMLIGFLTWLCVIWAQTNNNAANQNQPRFSVKGRVVNAATGEPVSGALLTLNGPEQHSGFSGADGRFEMDGVPVGSVFITAKHPGYSELVSLGSRAQQITITDNVDGITVKMPPNARISGMVRDSDGEPVESIQIMTLNESILNGRKALMPRGGTNTDEAGKFVLDNLPAGSYYISTAQKAVYPGLPPTDEAARLMFGAQYYPNSPDLTSAQKVEVKPGEDTHIDIAVSEVHGVRVSFSVNPPAQFVFGSLESGDGKVIHEPFTKNNKTGKFVAASVPPGTWNLIVMAQGGGQGNGQSRGEATVNVGSTDIDNVQIELGSPTQIPVIITGGDAPQQVTPATGAAGAGRMSVRSYVGGSTLSSGVEGAAGSYVMPMANVSLQKASSGPINMTNGQWMYSMNTSRSGQSSVPAIENVPPGSYRLTVRTWGTNCLESATSGSLDLTKNNYIVSPGSPPQAINVNLQSNCPSLDVSLNQQKQALVLAIGDSLATDPSLITLNSEKGTLGNLAPGDYTLYAFTKTDGLEYANPDVMKSYSGQHVTLAAGQKASVTLDVIDPEAK